MRIMVVGLGSMGKRRIRLIKQNFDNIEIIGVDSREDRRAEAFQLFGIESYDELDSAIQMKHPEAAFVCTSPIGHPALTQKCLQAGMHIFSEINLVNSNHDELIETAALRNLVLFLSSTPMYREETKHIGQMIRQLKDKKCFYRYHVGQYLPDWHPWESHRDFFVADRRTNGCREIFAIELPWLLKAFGSLKGITVKADSITSLDLGFPDAYHLLLEHESGHKGVLSIDIVSRKAVRDLEIIAEDLHLFWDGTANGLNVYDIDCKQLNNIRLYSEVNQDPRYAENIIENAYLAEITAFFESISGIAENQYYDFRKDKEILEIIDTIEKSAGGFHDHI